MLDGHLCPQMMRNCIIEPNIFGHKCPTRCSSSSLLGPSSIGHKIIFNRGNIEILHIFLAIFDLFYGSLDLNPGKKFRSKMCFWSGKMSFSNFVVTCLWAATAVAAHVPAHVGTATAVAVPHAGTCSWAGTATAVAVPVVPVYLIREKNFGSKTCFWSGKVPFSNFVVTCFPTWAATAVAAVPAHVGTATAVAVPHAGPRTLLLQ